MSTESRVPRPGDRTLGVVLLVAGGLILAVKLIPWLTFHALVKLWPLLLIWLGWRMLRDDEAGEHGTPGERARRGTVSD